MTQDREAQRLARRIARYKRLRRAWARFIFSTAVVEAGCLVVLTVSQEQVWAFWLSVSVAVLVAGGSILIRMTVARRAYVAAFPDIAPPNWVTQVPASSQARPPRLREQRPRTKSIRPESGMRYLVTGITLLCAVWVILSNKYDDGTRNWAYGTVGAVIGYWLRG